MGRLMDDYAALYGAYEDVRAKKKALDEDVNLSDTGRAEALERAVASLELGAKTAAVVDGLDAARARTQAARVEATRTRIADAAYQSALSNAAHAIASGYLTTRVDVETIADMFKGDAVALARLRSAAAEAGADARPFDVADDYERFMGNIDKMRSNVERLSAADADTALISLRGNMDYIASRAEFEGGGDE